MVCEWPLTHNSFYREVEREAMKKSASEETAAKEIAAEETTVKDTDKEKMG